MRVLPVLDLMSGVVVRGIGGRRDEYRPLESPLIASPQPVDVAHAIAERFASREFYLADLDAIAGHEPAWDTYAALLSSGYDLWVDAGLADLPRANELAEFVAHDRSLTGVIAGLESLRNPQQLAEMLTAVGPSRLVFSLDLKHGSPLARHEGAFGADPFDVARAALTAGVERMIVLDLANVGQDAGLGTLDLCRRIHVAAPHVELVAGGGVRGLDDLRAVAAAGCRRALVASALHDGRLTPADLQAADEL
ncbi:MAG: hypothetical protein KF708_05940 [Pirellulales bacterium]|nr:hypothetical protein [Pirellulales bacterium]